MIKEVSANLIMRNNISYYVRPNTLDEWVVDEVSGDAAYIRPLKIKANDIVLDIGMNIGVFTVTASKKKAIVYGFEPDVENFKMAEKNCEINNVNAIIQNVAISDVVKEQYLYLNEKKNRGQHSFTKVKGRRKTKVFCKGINDVIAEYKPNKIKIDCEGEEYNILKAIKSWDGIEAIRLEWHRRILQDSTNTKFEEIIEVMLNAGFDMIGKKDGKGWTQMVTFIKC
jgi:FkbM family methyltransferase